MNEAASGYQMSNSFHKEFPLSATDGINLVRGITQSIECELRRATVDVIDADKRVAALNQGIRSAPWIEGWGVEVFLDLEIVENSVLTPGIGVRLPSITRPSPNAILVVWPKRLNPFSARSFSSVLATKTTSNLLNSSGSYDSNICHKYEPLADANVGTEPLV